MITSEWFYQLSRFITMLTEYINATKNDAKLLVDIYNAAFYSDFIKYGECPAYGRTISDMEKSIEKISKNNNSLR